MQTVPCPPAEYETRVFPATAIEASYARNRDERERPPWPVAGDRCYFRPEEWGPAYPAEFVAVEAFSGPQPYPEWEQLVIGRDTMTRGVYDNTTGAPVREDDGSLRIVRVEDPWPLVRVQLAATGALHDTWESRLRGAPGWLPVGFHERTIRLPGDYKEYGLIRSMETRNW